jgi:hypothetical protein
MFPINFIIPFPFSKLGQDTTIGWKNEREIWRKAKKIFSSIFQSFAGDK